MSVVISNKKQFLLNDVGIDVIKEIHGEFTVEEIVNTFQNFFYQRMILDLTAIKGYENITTIQSLFNQFCLAYSSAAVYQSTHFIFRMIKVR